MKTKTKGILAAIGFICSIGAYYYLSLAIEWIWSDICAKHYCMKTLSLAEFLSIEAAAIGVYFVVTSLDDWKHQDKYNNAKNRIAILNQLQPMITIGFGMKLCNFYTVRKGEIENKVTKIDTERNYVVECFNAYLQDTQIFKQIQDLDRENYYVKNCLYQEDFDVVIKHAHKFISNCCNAIHALDITENDLTQDYYHYLNRVYINNRAEEHIFKTKLADLNKKLNKVIS
ncbi:hypothetical protein [Acinetobacter terrae]|uniref:Uncharacterized protein n=1 Tax=Acinetobacter terrae TaxID=2731247 RepID=A0A4R0EG54_9GAMM|nr:hypothetical protein [Acinetobacter terrae]TCB55552.1 hypothetical protein E0H85_14805 [Acinetobacter terrae]